MTAGETDRQVLGLVTLRGLVAHNRGEWYPQLRLELRRTRDEPPLATAILDSHLLRGGVTALRPTPYGEVIELAAALRETGTRAGAMRAVAFARNLLLAGPRLLRARRSFLRIGRRCVEEVRAADVLLGDLRTMEVTNVDLRAAKLRAAKVCGEQMRVA